MCSNIYNTVLSGVTALLSMQDLRLKATDFTLPGKVSGPTLEEALVSLNSRQEHLNKRRQMLYYRMEVGSAYACVQH
jgi:hypothetical protein